MAFVRLEAVAAVVLLTQGCASIVNDTTNPVRFETYSQAGVEVTPAPPKS